REELEDQGSPENKEPRKNQPPVPRRRELALGQNQPPKQERRREQQRHPRIGQQADEEGQPSISKQRRVPGSKRQEQTQPQSALSDEQRQEKESRETVAGLFPVIEAGVQS